MLNHKRRTGENMAYSPEIWKAMFEAVPSRALGLEIDPSHLVFLGIDYIQAIQDFGDRIVHVHAKDIDIDERKRATSGFTARPSVSCRDSATAGGAFAHQAGASSTGGAVITALTDAGYEGSLDIEHEDEVFAASAMSKIEGKPTSSRCSARSPTPWFSGYRYLAPLMPLDATSCCRTDPSIPAYPLFPTHSEDSTVTTLRRVVAVAVCSVAAITSFVACGTTTRRTARAAPPVQRSRPNRRPSRTVSSSVSGAAISSRCTPKPRRKAFTEATGIPDRVGHDGRGGELRQAQPRDFVWTTAER